AFFFSSRRRHTRFSRDWSSVVCSSDLYAAPAFQPAPVAKLISKDYARERGKLISMERALREVQPGTPAQLDEGDTIYLTTADARSEERRVGKKGYIETQRDVERMRAKQ